MANYLYCFNLGLCDGLMGKKLRFSMTGQGPMSFFGIPFISLPLCGPLAPLSRASALT